MFLISRKIRLGLVLEFILSAFFFISLQNAYAHRLGKADLDLEVKAEEAYDDNIAYVKNNPESDLSTTVSLRFKAKHEGKLRVLEASGNIGRQMFNKNSDYDNTSVDFAFGLLNELSKHSRIVIRDTFLRADQPRSFEDELGRTSGRFHFYKNRFNLEYIRDITRQLIIHLCYAYNTDEFSRSDLSDSYLHKGGFGLEYALSSATTFLASYDFSKRVFDSGGAAPINTFASGLKQYFTKQLYLQASTGVDTVRALDTRRHTKPLFIVSLVNDVDENTQASAEFRKGYTSHYYNKNILDYWQVCADLTRKLFKRLSISLSAIYSEASYISDSTKERLRGANIKLTYDLKDNMKVYIGNNYSRQDSNVLSHEYSKDMVNVGLSIEF